MRLLPILLLLLPFLAQAQKGDYYLRHFQPPEDRVSHENYAIEQDGKGILCFANRKGVLKFDGRHWNLVHTPSSALSMRFNPLSKSLFVGCRGSFGEIRADSKGIEQYHALSGTMRDFGDVSHIEASGNLVYFLSDRYLFEYSLDQHKITHKWETEDYQFFSIFNHNGDVYAFTDSFTFLKVKNGQLSPTPWVLEGERKEHLVFAREATRNQTLVGTVEGSIYRLDNGKFSKIALEDARYLEESHPLDAVVVNDTLAFISTLNGGALAFNWQNGKTVAYLNYQAGLPDNEVLAIGKDAEGGIWLAHEFGFTRVDWGLPFKVYSNYPGLQGHIIAATEFDGRLYIGTSVGLFYLERITDFKEIKKIAKEAQEAQAMAQNMQQQVLATVQSNVRIAEEPIAKVEEAAKPAKTSWLKRVFSKKGKKKKKGEEEETEEEQAVDVSSPPPPADTATVASIKADTASASIPPAPPNVQERATVWDMKSSAEIYELQSAYWAFRRVPGINGKCSQLIEANGQLVVGSNAGLFLVEGSKVKELSKEAVRYLYVSRSRQRIYASAYSDQLIYYQRENGIWKRRGDFDGIRARFSHIGEDAKRLWLCSSKYLYAVHMQADGSIGRYELVEVDNPYNDEIVMLELQGRPYFVLSSGFYSYSGHEKLAIDSAMMEAYSFTPRFLHAQANMLWMHNGNMWMPVPKDRITSGNLHYLRLFDLVSSISLSDNERFLWVITKDNRLHKVLLKEPSHVGSRYDAYLKAVYGAGKSHLDLRRFTVSQDKSELRFVFAMPDYLDRDEVMYQHRLVGIDANWSEWSAQSEIFYGSLPSGRYRLLVKAKNSSGKESELDPIIFTVQPPYWERTWFYGVEIVFFGALLLFSFRLNRTKQRNKMLSKALTFLTLILIVEFLQVTVESQVTIEKTPVINFIIQAGIALLIFPIEKGLSYLIVKKAQEEGGA